ncbi:MAG: DNA replication/repair protein RecF [Ancrocorticia sp.]
MYLTDLALSDFRSYRQMIIKVGRGVTTFVGENGQGKTNIVEGIAYLATLSSHRVSSDHALVRQGAQAGVVQARVMHGEHPSTVEVEIFAGRANRARLNRGQVRPAELLGQVRTVVFAPEDLELVRGEPGVRRQFLDDIMVQLRPRLAGVKAEYEKVLRQRAALLKACGAQRRRGIQVDEGALDVWDMQLARLGAQITAARSHIVAGLRPHVAEYYRAVSGGRGVARVDYLDAASRGVFRLPPPEQFLDERGVVGAGFVGGESGAGGIAGVPGHSGTGTAGGTGELGTAGGAGRVDSESVDGAAVVDAAASELPAVTTRGEEARQLVADHEAELADVDLTEIRLLTALAEKRDQEIARGVNLVGPHRDEVVLSLGTLPAKGYASHGESWSYALALRLGAWKLLREDVSGEWAEDGEPILILDDVFAELDARRRERLAEIVSEAQQVFVTAAVGDDLPEKLAGARFWVHDGVVERVGELGAGVGELAGPAVVGDGRTAVGEKSGAGAGDDVNPEVSDVNSRGEDDG